MKQRESYRVPRSSGKHGDHGVPPPLLSEIMPKHDEDGGDIGKNIGGQLGLVCIDSTQRPIKNTYINLYNIPFVSVRADQRPTEK